MWERAEPVGGAFSKIKTGERILPNMRERKRERSKLGRESMWMNKEIIH